MKKEVAKALKSLEDVWDEPAAKGGVRMPEFDGSARITDMQFEVSPKGNAMIVTTFTIVEPEKLEGRETKKFDMISKTSWPFFKGYAEQIGLELPSSADPDDIESAILSFVEDNDKIYDISVTHDGEYNRVNVTSDASEKKEKEEEEEDTNKEKRKKLIADIKKNKLKVDPDDYEDTDDLEAAVKKAMKKKK